MNTYDHTKVEKKWQKVWESKKPNKVKEDPKKPKFYALIEFPFPSGAGLHVGHIRSNTAMDIISRKRRMEGYNVLYPIGWDAFGLPTENYAIKTGIQPAIVTKQNTDNFRKQLKALGFSFDWSREIDTTDPKYYKWTQWIFLQFLKKGLAYKKKMIINWCPKDLIGLANEEVVNGCCDRCGTQVEKKEKEQWMLAITKYADRLDKDLDETEFLEKIKIQQRNWIGKSEGMIFSAPIRNTDITIQTFSAHFEAFAADTFVVIAPDHPLLEKILTDVPDKETILKFARDMVAKRQAQGFEDTKESEGIFTGRYIVDPVGNGDLPIWIASFALADYGTGIVKCSAHDERDFAFAKKYNIKLKPVMFPTDQVEAEKVRNLSVCFTDATNGVLSEPQQFQGRNAKDSRREIIDYLEKNGIAKRTTTFKLRDWVFSRQRYWGEPIPVVHCEKCGIVPLPDKELPLKLPKVKNYVPTQNGESPLSAIDKWVNTKCPNCKGKAKRETDTMPNWAGSSWYYLRYTDAKNKKAFADPKNLKYWTPVDWYNGGMEHTTLHLLYSRFWHKFLYDLGLVTTKEPYKKRTSHGLILAEGGAKMSKSVGNVINPDDIIKTVGADTLRIHEMFMGPFDQAIAWDTNSIAGSRRFIERVWKLAEKIGENKSEKIEVATHRTIKKVSEDIEKMGFNTAISSIMILLNDLEKDERIPKEIYETLLKILAPFAPHVTEELWSLLKNKGSVHANSWPQYDPSKLIESTVRIMIQVNGKFRGEMSIPADTADAEVEKMALNMDDVKKWIVDKNVKKVIVIKNKLINIVV
jgi:leucyl-tRNA synthetase